MAITLSYQEPVQKPLSYHFCENVENALSRKYDLLYEIKQELNDDVTAIVKMYAFSDAPFANDLFQYFKNKEWEYFYRLLPNNRKDLDKLKNSDVSPFSLKIKLNLRPVNEVWS